VCTRIIPFEIMRLSYSYQGQQQLFESRKTEVLIGRPKGAAPVDLDLSPALTVSRPHARIWLSEGQYWIEDLDSKRGTQINGHEIKGKGRWRLHFGDLLVIGETTLRVEALDEQFDAHSTLPPTVQDLDPKVEIGKTLDAKTPGEVRLTSSSPDTSRRLHLLYELPLKLATESRLDQLLQTVVEEVVKVIPNAARGALLLKDAQTGALVLRAHIPVGEPALSMTLAQRAVARREGFVWRQSHEENLSSAL